MFIYPYKVMNAGKFTKYIISITENKGVLIEKRFKGKRQAQELFVTSTEVKGSTFPKEIKQAALWALHDAPNLGL